MASISKINKPVISAIRKTIGKAFNKISTTDQNKIAGALRTGLENGVDSASKNTIRLGLKYNSAVKGNISDKSAEILNRAIRTSERADEAIATRLYEQANGTAGNRLAGKKVTGKMTGAEFKARRAATANNGSAASTTPVKSTAPTKDTASKSSAADDLSNDEWLDNGYNAETELGGMRRGYDQNAAPKASSRDMGATQQEIDSLKGETNIKKIRNENKEYRRKAAREEANKGGSGESGKAWYDDEESRAFAQSQADEEYQQLKVDWNNKSKDLDEKIAKAKEAGDTKAIQKLQDEKREAYLGYRKKREDFYEKDSKGNLVYHKDKNGRNIIGRKQVDPNMLDWVRAHGYDKAAAGIGALGFAGSVAFGGAKSNADLYSNPF